MNDRGEVGMILLRRTKCQQEQRLRVGKNTREGRRSGEATAAGPKYLEKPGDAIGALEGVLANRRRGKNY